MNIKDIHLVNFLLTWLFLQNLSFCCAENSSTTPDGNASNLEPESIISDIIPDCIFGVKSVSYFLYTREIPFGKTVHMEDEHIPMQTNKTVAFLIHGFVSEANNSNYFELITAWLKREDINIFSVDWQDAACTGSFSFTDLITYVSAVHNIPVVGKYVADFVTKLVKEYNVKLNETVVVGHSLGAHLAGISGKRVQEELNEKYREIVGLDPAGPEFEDKDCNDRLCESDATFVQIFHTSYLAGMHKPIGDEDFYFNGGMAQPGCAFTSCSHSRAVVYLTMSVTYSSCFVGTPWKLNSDNVFNWKQCRPNICAYPGIDTPEKKSNTTYYVTTACGEPFCTL